VTNKKNKKNIAAPVASTLAVLGSLMIHTTAQAITIGVFTWDQYPEEQCSAQLCGPFFSVENDSNFFLGEPGASFSNVSVDLLTDGGALSLPLPDILAGDASQSSPFDLAGVTVLSAGLSLSFGLPGSIQLLDDGGNVVSALTGLGSLLIDYSASVVQVPEPPLPLLLVSGLVLLAYQRRLRPKSRHPDRVLAA